MEPHVYGAAGDVKDVDEIKNAEKGPCNAELPAQWSSEYHTEVPQRRTTEKYTAPPFQVKSLFPPVIWVPMYFRCLMGKSTEEDLEVMGSLHYSLKYDLISGLAVGTLLVPQCIAYALVAGLPIRCGLYSSCFPWVMYIIFGTIRPMQLGPTASLSLLTGIALDGAGLVADNDRMLGAAFLALLAGVFSFFLGMCRFGFVLDYVSGPVMAAYVTASGIIILTTQLKDLLGVKIPRSDYWWQTIIAIGRVVKQTDGATVIMGLVLFAFLATLKAWKLAGNEQTRAKHRIWRWLPKHSTSYPFLALKTLAEFSAVVSVIAGWVWGYCYRQAGVTTVKLVGSSSTTGLTIMLPGSGLSSALMGSLISSAPILAIMGYMEAMGVGTKLAAQSRYRINFSQELLGLGSANIVSSFMGGLPITGGFSRTAAAASFGATSPLSTVLSCTIVLLTIYLIMPVLEKLPSVALVPLIIQGALGVTSFQTFVTVFHGSKMEFAVMLATFVTALSLTVKEGLYAGLGCSMLKLLYDIGMPNMVECGQMQDGSFRDLRNYPDAVIPNNAVIVRMDARLNFMNSRRFKEFCLRAALAVDPTKSKFLIIDFKSINSLDMTGRDMLADLAQMLQKRSQHVLLANVKGPLVAQLRATRLDEALCNYGGHICWNMDQALDIAQGGDPGENASLINDLHDRMKASQPESWISAWRLGSKV